jgi:hypothetical protein
LIARRRDGHWANKLLAHSSATRAWPRVTTRWKRLQLLRAEGESSTPVSASPTPMPAWTAYQSELFRFDQLYRQFNHAADGGADGLGLVA